MSTATSSTAAPPSPGRADEATVLVCAAPGPDAPPQVVLADGSYETDAERVFWRRSPSSEVLRIPLQTRVTVRPVRRFSAQSQVTDGEQRLLEALAPHLPVPTPRSAPGVVCEPQPPAPTQRDPLTTRLTVALRAGETSKAEGVAGVLWRRESLAHAHAAVASCLADLDRDLADLDGDRDGDLVSSRVAASTARALLERLRALSPEPSVPVTGRVGGHRVILAVPPGDPHTLALTALAHQLQEAGYVVLVVEDVPLADLTALVVRQQPLAVVISAHLRWNGADARAFVAALRAVSADTLLAVGGPGAPSVVPRCDLVTSDPEALLEALRTRSGALTPRERQVLLAVADGRTTNEIAEALGVSPATVRTHLDNVFTKTGTEHRAAAVARALRRGWIR